MQRAAWSRISLSGSGSTNSCQWRIRDSTGSYLRSCRSISRKPVTLPILLRSLHGGGLLLCHLSERTAVFDRHHFAEQGTIALPIGEDLGRALGIGIARMIGDQHMQPLGILGCQVGHHVDAAVALEIVVEAVFLLGDLFFFRSEEHTSE